MNSKTFSKISLVGLVTVALLASCTPKDYDSSGSKSPLAGFAAMGESSESDTAKVEASNSDTDNSSLTSSTVSGQSTSGSKDSTNEESSTVISQETLDFAPSATAIVGDFVELQAALANPVIDAVSFSGDLVLDSELTIDRSLTLMADQPVTLTTAYNGRHFQVSGGSVSLSFSNVILAGDQVNDRGGLSG